MQEHVGMHLSMGEYIHVASGEGACGIKRCRERRGAQCRRKMDELLNTAAEASAVETDRHWVADGGRLGGEGRAAEIW